MTETDPIQELQEAFDKFVEQYELDMRGDKKVNGGSVGVINTIRKVKEEQDRYPSLTWLMAHKPFQTLAVGLGVWLFLWGLTVAGLIQYVAAMLGLHVPSG